MILVKCKECGAQYKVPSSMGGRRALCTCGNKLTVPNERKEGEVSGKRNDAEGVEKWYIKKGRKKYGPVTLGNIKKYVKRGKITKTDHVYAKSLGGWKKVGNVECLEKVAPDEGEKWYCYVDGTTYGPYSPDQVRALIKDKRIGGKTRVRRKGKGQWRLLSSVQKFSAFLDRVRRELSTQPTQKTKKKKKNVWYYMRDGTRYGPLSLGKLLKAIESGDVRGSDRVWSQELDNWKKVSDIPQLRTVVQKAEGHQEGELWYYRHRGEVRGPVSLYKLKDLINHSKLVAGDHVFSKKLGTWKDVRNVPKLRKTIQAARRGEVDVKDESAVWFYYKGGKGRGPFMLRSLVKRFASGKLDANTKVYGPGCDSWQRAGEVPQLTRYISGNKGQSHGESATDMVDAMPDKKRTRNTSKRTIVPLITGGVVAMVLILFVVGYQTGWFDSGTNGSVVEDATVEVPRDPRQVVKTWLDIFLANKEELNDAQRQTRQDNLEGFYPASQGRMDVYADDVRSALQRLVESRGIDNLSLEKVSRRVVRAEDRESFCYHLPFQKSEVEVFKPMPDDDDSPIRLQKMMSGEDFRVVRIYRLLYEGQPVHPSGYVLLSHSDKESTDAPWRIVGLGRVAHVGAQWEGRRITYLAGYKASSMLESDAYLQVGVEKRGGNAGRDDQAVGEVMSIDANLVPPEIIERRAVKMRDGLSERTLLITGETADSQDLEDIEEKYGPPAREDNMDLFNSDVLTIEPSGEEGLSLYSDVKAHRYGNFGLATDPISGGVVGFIFRREDF